MRRSIPGREVADCAGSGGERKRFRDLQEAGLNFAIKAQCGLISTELMKASLHGAKSYRVSAFREKWDVELRGPDFKQTGTTRRVDHICLSQDFQFFAH